MFLKKNTNWNLLAKFIAGETNEKETATVNEWANDSAENRALLKEIKSDWKTMDNMKERFDVDKAWSKLHNRMEGSGIQVNAGSVAEVRRISTRSMFMRIAASLLLVIML